VTPDAHYSNQLFPFFASTPYSDVSGKKVSAKFHKKLKAETLILICLQIGMNRPHPDFVHPLPQWRRVALLGIAQRRISIKFSQKTRKQNNAKPLPVSIKTLGELIQVKRVERNLTPGYLAAKMGIAANLVRSWEDGSCQPDNRQLEVLASVLGFGAFDNYAAYNSRRSGQLIRLPEA
jgi:ribosome-binding protein aMBF1 (putative translation factor)